MASVCAAKCGKNGAIACSLCDRSYCSKVCARDSMSEHLKQCRVDEELFRYDDEAKFVTVCCYAECRKENVSLRCSRCKNAMYCDAKCQRAAYRTHKAECVKQTSARSPEFLNVVSFLQKYPRHRRMIEFACSKAPGSFIVLVFSAGDQRKTNLKVMTLNEAIATHACLAADRPLFNDMIAANHTIVAVIFSDGGYICSALSSK